MSLRAALRRALAVVLVALAFLAGGLVVPQLVSATVSAGSRSAYFPLPPTRILDTRTTLTPTGQPGKVGPGETIDIEVAGFRGLAPAATAAVLNVTVTDGTRQSLLTLFPAGTPRPTASSVNFVAGEVKANAVTVAIGSDGEVSIFNDQGEVHIVVDLSGFYDDVTFDDRYHTKAQADANLAAAVSKPDHITGAQVADRSLTGDDILDGSLALPDLVGGKAFEVYILPDLSVPGLGCQVVSVHLGLNRGFRLLVPMRVAGGVVGSINLSAATVGLDINGGAALQICNEAPTTFTATAPKLEFYVL